jgi:hypothetical protein
MKKESWMATCEVVMKKPRTSDGRCPECGRKGKTVARITLESLLCPEAKERLAEAAYLFCETPTCSVVYFAPDEGSVFHKPDLTVRVGIKETKPPRPLCYCFGFTQEMVEEELATTGTTTIPDRIAAEVRAGNCRCEVTNPRGRCCLGDVRRAIRAWEGRSPSTVETAVVAEENCCSVPQEEECCAVPEE